MRPVSIRLSDYADPATLALAQAAQARNLCAVLRGQEKAWLELDFSGVSGVSAEFSEEFCRLAQDGLAQTWLLPRHYKPSCHSLVNRLLARLKRQREHAWIDGCERFCGKEP